MHEHDDNLGHDHEHRHPDQPDEEDTLHSYYQFLEIALRELLIEKRVIRQSELVDVHAMMDRRGPHNGARMIAKGWTDLDYLALMRKDATVAAQELGLEPTWLNLIVVENTLNQHNLVVCTLCSCYPWPLLGLPPDWYKSRAYRSDAVKRPRSLLRQFGTDLANDVSLRVHDSSADMRYLVMPMRPAETDGWSEEELARLVTRDSMIGVRVALTPQETK